METEPTITALIQGYQATADEVVQIFKRRFGTEVLLKGWREGLYAQSGTLAQEGIIVSYFFHGIGVAVTFADKTIDFDLAFLPEQRWDGFDLWRLRLFVQGQRKKYERFLDIDLLTSEFEQLEQAGLILNPDADHFTALHFWTKDLPESLRTVKQQK